jgi:protocadherin alpha
MEYVRLYSRKDGDNDTDCGTLRQMLKDAGYSKGELFGNRLTVLDTPDVMLPYIDNGGCEVIRRGKYWVVVEEGEGEYIADCTDGSYSETNRCETCRNHQDDCTCVYCDCCHESYDGGCEECSMCDHCDLCIEHERCRCERCEECNERIEDCGCDRCEECSELTNNCECERCPDCEELTSECECETDDNECENEDTSRSAVVDAPEELTEVTLTPEQVREKLNRIYLYLRNFSYKRPYAIDCWGAEYEILIKAANSIELTRTNTTV